MDDVFKDAMAQIHKEAPPELASGFRAQMQYISARFKHTSKTVASCLDGLSEAPTLLELLTAAFVVNGGVLFKYDMDPLEELDSLEDTELDFIKAIEALSPIEPRSDRSSAASASSPLDPPPWVK